MLNFFYFIYLLIYLLFFYVNNYMVHIVIHDNMVLDKFVLVDNHRMRMEVVFVDILKIKKNTNLKKIKIIIELKY